MVKRKRGWCVAGSNHAHARKKKKKKKKKGPDDQETPGAGDCVEVADWLV
jgi:hypothetical protein